MKLTKARLKRIIKEELEAVTAESAVPQWRGGREDMSHPPDGYTEFDLYAHFDPIVTRALQFRDDMDHASGFTAGSDSTLVIPDKLTRQIWDAISKMEKARINLAKAIGQDPYPHLRSE